MLQNKAYFRDIEFRLIGSGSLFDETVAPIQRFPNVTLEKRFLTRVEIARLHQQYGIFLCPTRMDSQGVSRDEAMASGLVPVTNSVAAVPEFVDAECGMLTPAEDASGLASAIAELYENPERFLKLSEAAAKRVARQSGFDRIIAQEIELLRGRG
jgi:glycosyltransferase involved in cell wall biosynthesis